MRINPPPLHARPGVRRRAVVPAAPAVAQTTLKMNISVSQNSHYGVAVDTFAREVEARTGGRYKIQNFYSGALGAERESIEALQVGTLDLTMTSTGPVPNFVPEVAILDIPFLMRDYPHARAVLDGPIGQEMLAKFPAKGIVALAWGENGFRHMTNSKRPVNRPGRPQGPQDADDGKPGPHPGLQAVRHHSDADGVHRGVHRAAAGDRGRPGESAVGDLGGEVRPGAEVHDAHRPRLFAGADPDEQGGVGQARPGRQGRVRRRREGGGQGQSRADRRGRAPGRRGSARQGDDRSSRTSTRPSSRRRSRRRSSSSARSSARTTSTRSRTTSDAAPGRRPGTGAGASPCATRFSRSNAGRRRSRSRSRARCWSPPPASACTRSSRASSSSSRPNGRRS